MSPSDFRLSQVRTSLVNVWIYRDDIGTPLMISIGLDLLATCTECLQATHGQTTIQEALTRPSKYLKDGSTLPPHLPTFLDIADVLDL